MLTELHPTESTTPATGRSLTPLGFQSLFFDGVGGERTGFGGGAGSCSGVCQGQGSGLKPPYVTESRAHGTGAGSGWGTIDGSADCRGIGCGARQGAPW